MRSLYGQNNRFVPLLFAMLALLVSSSSAFQTGRQAVKKRLPFSSRADVLATNKATKKFTEASFYKANHGPGLFATTVGRNPLVEKKRVAINNGPAPERIVVAALTWAVTAFYMVGAAARSVVKIPQKLVGNAGSRRVPFIRRQLSGRDAFAIAVFVSHIFAKPLQKGKSESLDL